MADTNPRQPFLPFTTEELDVSKALIESAEKSLIFVTPVSDDDVKAAAKLDDMRESFIRDVITEMTNAKGSIPTLANLQKLVYYYSSFTSGYDVEDIIKDFHNRTMRSRMVHGGKAYDQASRYYKGLDSAIKDEVEGAAESKKRLAKYFVSNNNKGGDKLDKNTPDAPK
jgi:hypothetical protein